MKIFEVELINAVNIKDNKKIRQIEADFFKTDEHNNLLFYKWEWGWISRITGKGIECVDIVKKDLWRESTNLKNNSKTIIVKDGIIVKQTPTILKAI